MIVNIELSEWLKKYVSGKTQVELEIAEGTTAVEAICKAGAPDEEIGFISVLDRGDKWILVERDYVLKPGDVLRVYPPIIGG